PWKIADVNGRAFGGNQLAVGERDDIGRFVQGFFVDQPRAFQELVQSVVRDGRDGQLFHADTRRKAYQSTVSEEQDVARIDQMWVFDIRVFVPDLRPIPWIGKIDRRNAPERIAGLDCVAK